MQCGNVAWSRLGPERTEYSFVGLEVRNVSLVIWQRQLLVLIKKGQIVWLVAILYSEYEHLDALQ